MATFWVESGTLQAASLIPGSLEDSRDKWEYLFSRCVAGELVCDGGSRTCSLCREYVLRKPHDCVGCPIWAYTGQFDCRGTPYEDYYQAAKLGDLPAATSAAEEMVEFLEKLLEGGF